MWAPLTTSSRMVVCPVPEYRFDYSYRVQGTRTIEFEDDDEAREFAWGRHPDDVPDYSWDTDVDIDTDDIDIIRLKDDGTVDEYLYED